MTIKTIGNDIAERSKELKALRAKQKGLTQCGSQRAASFITSTKIDRTTTEVISP